MAMGPGNLARHHDLDVGNQRVAGDPGKTGVAEPQYPAFGLRGTDQLGRPHRLRLQIPPMPQVWHRRAVRLDTDAAADPGRRQVLRAQSVVVVLQLLLRRLDVRKLQHWRSSPMRVSERECRYEPGQLGGELAGYDNSVIRNRRASLGP